MSAIAVDYAQLSMASELLRRQRDHTTAVSNYLDAQCRVSSGDFGLLLQVLHPVNELIVDGANLAMEGLGSLAQWSSKQMTATLNSYVAVDRDAHERASKLMAQIGVNMPAFNDPRGGLPGLGGAAGSADSDYGVPVGAGHPLEDYFANVVDIGESGTSLVGDTVSDALDRAGSYGNRGGVVERTDPESYLVTPVTQENWVEDLRWKAGVILGSVDWVAEKFIGVSILQEYVFKPFSGDWQALGRASDAWSHGGQALMETGSNFSGLPGQLDSWTGGGSAAFHGAMAGMAGASVGASYAFDAVGSMVDKVALVAKIAASGIATLLRKISNKLLRMAAEAAVPIVGWAAFAAEAAIMIGEIISWLGLINSLITAILDAIAELVSAREKIVQALFMVEDLVASASTHVVKAVV